MEYGADNMHINSGVGTGGWGATGSLMYTEGAWPPATLEGYNVIIIIPLSTKAVIQVHKDPPYEYHLQLAS